MGRTGGGNDRPAPREWGQDNTRENSGGKFDHKVKWAENTHPQIKITMEAYQNKFRRIHMRDILEANNLQMYNLPKSEWWQEGGICKLCVHHVLGRCTDTTCDKKHVGGPCLEPAYVKEMVEKLGDGIKKLVKEGGKKRPRGGR